ncbi:MAG TPA: carboxypeptidase-like regulatory domain-containing protein [Mucilaginibacter sp.]|nr:carboxypeptidase-like regulatory domain-containing protein [Mucilaginibacter sp.]
MRYLLLAIVLCSGFAAFAQKISGMVIDKSSREPLAGALVSTGEKTVRTDKLGEFEINAPHPADSLKISAPGYKTLIIAISKTNEFITINLEPKITNLNEVTIYGDKSFKKDSLANRDEYTKQFHYTPPKLKDVVGFNPGSGTYQLLSINVLTLIDYLTYKSSPEYKFKQVLVRDEHEQYVDEKFNRGVVSRITDLKGDTLTTFLAQYRPTYQFVLKATDYDMEVYIKDCYKKFEKEGFTIKGPFVKQD